MPITYNVNEVYDDFIAKGGKTGFSQSLKDILELSKNNPKINDISELAYLLATASVESDYSLQRWEADYVCGLYGKPYKERPCNTALNYYKSTDGKLNYYNLGIDNNGLPYFGRGLIQLTGKDNYKTYGDLIGVDLVSNGNLALIPENSYNIAVEYLSLKRDGKFILNDKKRSTFDLVKDNEFTLARKSVNGGTKDLSKVNENYYLWYNILLLKAVKVQPKSKWKKVVGVGLAVATVGVTMTLVYFALKKTNKLPNFMKKLNL